MNSAFKALSATPVYLLHVHDTTVSSIVRTHVNIDFRSNLAATKSTSLQHSIFMEPFIWLVLLTHNFENFASFKYLATRIVIAIVNFEIV